MIENPTIAFETRLAELMLGGRADFLEAGDRRRPGLPGSLRALGSGDAEKPLAIGDGSKPLVGSELPRYTLAEGLAILRGKALELGADPGIGAAAALFTVKLRKNNESH